MGETQVLKQKEKVMSETQILADYVAQAKYDDLPAEVVAHVKDLISDTIACGLGGRKTLEGDLLINIVKEMGGKPEATIIGEKTKLSCMHAAHVNCVICNMLDYDETLARMGHICNSVVPTALAIGERVNASGKDIINAVVLGCEVITRINDAVNPSEEAFWKTFERGAGMPFGTPTVAGKLLGLSGEQIANAFGLTGIRGEATRGAPGSWDRTREGMPRWMKVRGTRGRTDDGIWAAFLAQKGFPGNRWILDEGRGYEVSVGSDRYDPTKLTANLGKKYEMMRLAFKFYSACRWTSSSLDAVEAIVSENGIKAEDVEQVIVRGQKSLADDFAIYEPAHIIAGEFSIPHVVSMVLLREPTGPNWYTEDKLKSPRVQELRNRVKLEHDPKSTKIYYEECKYDITVDITTKDGRSFSKHAEYAKGEPENPWTHEEHIDKLRNMARWLGMKEKQIEELVKTFDRLEEVGNISELTRLLVPA